MPSKIASLDLDPDVTARVQRLADNLRRPAELLVRDAVEQYLEREEGRERMRHDAMRAWQSYQATGRHATEEEVDTLLGRLEAGESCDPPRCHV